MSRENSHRYSVQVTKVVPLSGIPSASGMALLNEVLYIAGDDSPFLYRLDSAYRQLPPLQLFQTKDFSTGRLPKALKPDLEGLTTISINNEIYLFAIGSGSTEQRKKGYLLNVNKPVETVKQISLHNLYQKLENREDITQGQALNIEGVTATDNAVFLIQRGVGGKRNVLLKLDKSSVVKILNGEPIQEPAIGVTRLQLPEINGVMGGFSGITYFEGLLFVVASVENTNNPVLDGEVLGSFVGLIDAESGETNLVPVKGADSKIMPIKAESVVVMGKEKNKYKLLAVTDNDLGSSELLLLDFVVHAKP